MTTIAVLGAGNIGATLARKWSAAGHHVTIGSRNPAATDVGNLAAGIGAATASHADAVAGADAVLIALPGDAVAAVAAALGTALDGKIVIDATNNLAGRELNSISTLTANSPRAIPVHAFNSLGWENFDNPQFDGTSADLLWCGADGDTTTVVEALITDIGLRPVHVGGLDQIHVVDTLANLWFALAIGQGHGRHLAFKILTR